MVVNLIFRLNSCELQILLLFMRLVVSCLLRFSGFGFFFVIVEECCCDAGQAVSGCFFEAKLKKGLG